jgi:hypothetical protein
MVSSDSFMYERSKEEATERAGAQFVLVRSASKNFPPTETDTRAWSPVTIACPAGARRFPRAF